MRQVQPDSYSYIIAMTLTSRDTIPMIQTSSSFLQDARVWFISLT